MKKLLTITCITIIFCLLSITYSLYIHNEVKTLQLQLNAKSITKETHSKDDLILNQFSNNTVIILSSVTLILGLGSLLSYKSFELSLTNIENNLSNSNKGLIELKETIKKSKETNLHSTQKLFKLSKTESETSGQISPDIYPTLFDLFTNGKTLYTETENALLKDEIINTIKKFTKYLTDLAELHNDEISIAHNIHKSQELDRYFPFSYIDVIQKLYECKEIGSTIFNNPEITSNIETILQKATNP